MASTSSASNADLDAQITALRDDLSALTKAVQTLSEDKAASAKNRATEAASQAIGLSQEKIKAMREQLATVEGQVSEKVRANPYQSLALAAVVGFGAAALMARR